MKALSKLFCILLMLCVITSCSDKEKINASSATAETESEITVSSGNKIFSLPYFKDDSLNPYSAKQSLNFHINTLIYDSLTALDENFNIENIIADKIEIDGVNVSIKIKSNLKFSDGSDLTLEDIRSSYNTAKNNSFYSQRLKNINKFTVNKDVIEITLNNPDRFFAKNLNFPIIKGGSRDDNAVGSGRFVLNVLENKTYLSQNENSIREKGSIKEINLVSVQKYSQLSDKIKIGNVNFAYYNSNKDSAASSNTVEIHTNNLLYMGVNSNNKFLSNENIRKAVSLAVDRKFVMDNIYANLGNATAKPFNPLAKDLKTSLKIDLFDTKKSEEVLSTIGISVKNEEGIFLDFEGNTVSLKILINSDNQKHIKIADMLKNDFEKLGIGLEVVMQPSAEYKNNINNHNYDLFIAEVKLTPNNDISELISYSKLNSFVDDGTLMQAYNSFMLSELECEEFETYFDMKTPFVPIAYLNKTAECSRSVSGVKVSTEYDVFYNFSNFKIN